MKNKTFLMISTRDNKLHTVKWLKNNSYIVDNNYSSYYSKEYLLQGNNLGLLYFFGDFE